ncbi:Late embryogenesis abundant (LEA) hydroxyproline-rich glycoprotein family [Euphorbia peplus]|nr:Late embryogenesis abundant (LEA) hydroxyproline-rich glycoprotein family [Euphorbia peplus]
MSAKSSSIPYHPLPPQNVVVLTYYRPPPSPTALFLRRILAVTSTILLLSAAVFFLYPSDPTLHVSRISLHHIKIHPYPKPTLDLSFTLLVKVRNRDFFSLDYNTLDVSVGYRGRELGVVRSNGGKVRARGTSYVNATLELNGLEVIYDVFYLIEDLARGVVPFDTASKVDGELGVLFFKVPIQGRASCEIYVNTTDETIVREDCFP